MAWKPTCKRAPQGQASVEPVHPEGCSQALKFKTWRDKPDIDKHASLQQYGINDNDEKYNRIRP